jgi:hypothetical protein
MEPFYMCSVCGQEFLPILNPREYDHFIEDHMLACHLDEFLASHGLDYSLVNQ